MRSPRAPVLFGLLLVIPALALIACSDTLEVPSRNDTAAGTLEISVSTSGTDLDVDGYMIQVDTATARRVGSGDTVRSTVSAGTHLIRLADIATNCTLLQDNPRSASVTAETTAQVQFEVTCTARSQGRIQVTISSSGDEIDADGYSLALDTGDRAIVGANDQLEFTGLASRTYTLTLSGIAPNCRARQESSIQVSIVAQTVPVAFTVECFSAGIPGWHAIALPAGVRGIGVWATSDTDVFLAGADSVSRRGVILHYDGQQWVEQFHTAMYQGYIGGIWGTSSNDVFAGGDDLLLHYDGRQWSDFGVKDVNPSLYGVVWGTSAGNVFAGGSYDGDPGSGLIRQYDGLNWRALPGYSVGNYGRVYDITGTTPTDVYVTGDDSPYDVAPEEEWEAHTIRHYDGNNWSTSFESVWYYQSREHIYEPLGLWAAGNNDVFAVGSRGDILHFNGVSWTPMTSPTSGDLTDLWGRSPSDVYAAGPGGILHYDGTSWTLLGVRPETCRSAGSCMWGTANDVFVLSDAVLLHPGS
jgi:hypothetical protein